MRTFLLALVLGVAVWVLAVTAADPNVTSSLSHPITIQYVGEQADLILTGTVPQSADLTVRAPQSIWNSLNSGESSIRVVADLTGLGAGSHAVPLRVQIDARPVQIISISPQTLHLTLEKMLTRNLPVEPTITGQPAIGYQAGDAVLTPAVALVSGAESLVSRVDHLQAVINVGDARQNLQADLPIQAVDAQGAAVSGITLQPALVQIALPVTQQGGYRDLAVTVETTGTPAAGYHLDSVAALPPLVTIYSSDLALIRSMPGYVETVPLALSGASGDIQTYLGLVLPSGVSLIGDQTVQVEIGIAPIESSLTVADRPVLFTGLGYGLAAQLSPSTVDVILSGPLPTLNSLHATDIQVILDLTGRGEGIYQLPPTVNFTIPGVSVGSVLPGTVEVTITPK